eukprot:7365883-Ditylum_brightwellii.AAC.1
MDTFDSNTDGHVIIDLSSIPRGLRGPASEAPTLETALASEVGSVMRKPADAFLRSYTFSCNDPGEKKDWSIVLADPPRLNNRLYRSPKIVSLGRSSKRRVYIDNLSGSAARSCLQVGDVIKSINGKRIGPSYSAQRTEQLMADLIAEEGLISVVCGNDGGNDVLIQATVLKPKSDMTYEDMGLQVWYWGCLCIKSIKSGSLFKQTALSSEDHIYSINGISCDGMKPDAFAHIISNLPDFVTIVAKRKKERWNGMFG